jgi:hypothetical protein
MGEFVVCSAATLFLLWAIFSYLFVNFFSHVFMSGSFLSSFCLPEEDYQNSKKNHELTYPCKWWIQGRTPPKSLYIRLTQFCRLDVAVFGTLHMLRSALQRRWFHIVPLGLLYITVVQLTFYLSK